MVKLLNQADLCCQIDYYPTRGLLGEPDSLAYRIHAIEQYVHNRETWFGQATPQTGPNWGASGSLTPFTCVSGAGAYGADPGDEAFILGSDDTPYFNGNVYYNVHRIFVISASVNTPYYLRLAWGTGTLDEALAAYQYTVVMAKYHPCIPVQTAFNFVPVRTPRLASGTKLWGQCLNATDNATLGIYIGIHEYEG